MARNKTTVLSQKTRLSQCALWKLQSDFYLNAGIKAWLGTVPYYITSNPTITNGYSSVVVGLIRDLITRKEYDTSQPQYIIELGTGHGRFSFYIMRQLKIFEKLLAEYGVSFKYIMSDFAKSNIEFWSSHPQIQPFLKDGILDFACYDAVNDNSIHLINSNITLDQSSIKNPLVVICNYFFDSIPHDAFHVKDGILYEALPKVTTSSSKIKNKEVDSGLQSGDVSIDFEYKEIDADDYYNDPHLNNVLKYYQSKLTNPSTPLIPYAGIYCLNQLRKISDNRLLVIASDKAYGYLHEIDGLKDPTTLANGGFFPMVNFHAVGEYFKQCGEQSIIQSYRKGLKTCVFMTGLPALNELPNTEHAINEHIENLGPVDSFNVYKQFKQSKQDIDLQTLASLLQFCRWDPHVFHFFSSRVIDEIDKADKTVRLLFERGLKKIMNNYYYMPNNQNIPSDVALVFHTMHNYSEAIKHYNLATQYFGKDFSTLYNCALCHYLLDDQQTALSLFKESLSLNRESDKAREWVERLEQEISNG